MYALAPSKALRLWSNMDIRLWRVPCNLFILLYFYLFLLGLTTGAVSSIEENLALLFELIKEKAKTPCGCQKQFNLNMKCHLSAIPTPSSGWNKQANRKCRSNAASWKKYVKSQWIALPWRACNLGCLYSGSLFFQKNLLWKISKLVFLYD